MALLDLFDDLDAEGFEIARIAGGNHALIANDLRILPLRARVRHVGLDRFEGGHLTALRDTGLDEKPGRVTDGCDDLLRVEDILDELERLRFDPEQIRIDLAARQNDRVVVVCRDLIKRLIDLYRSAPILLVPTLDLAGGQRNDVDGPAGLL